MRTRPRPRALLALPLTLAFLFSLLPASALGVAPAPKVVIIVGPTGAQTDSYRSSADQIADTATAAGADVTKVYSPNATWANVRAAVDGANLIVYLGHGNGYPNPYSGSEWTDRANGWGLNRTPNGGDGDNWSTTMVYCGEKALTGTLTSSDGSAQWNYCGGSTNTDGISPAPGFVMIYNKACYTPGAGEGWDEPATESVAKQRVRSYSRPVLSIGAGAYFATDINARSLVDLVLRNPDMTFGSIARNADGYDADAQRHFNHADVSGAKIWIQRTNALGSLDYWYAFAGDPTRTPSGAAGVEPGEPQITRVAPRAGARWISTTARVRAWFDVPIEGLDTASFELFDSFGFRMPTRVKWLAGQLKAVLIPSRQLVPREWYTARLGGAIHSADGVPLTDYSWQFRTKNDGDGTSALWPKTKRLTFRIGTHTGYRFDADGRVVATRTSTLAGDSGANASTRRMLPGQSGYWFYVTNGLWAGHWLRASDALYLADDPPVTATVSDLTYDPPVRLKFLRGTHTGYQFDANGALLAEKTYTLWRNSGADTSSLEAVANQAGTWFKVVNGVWAGYWIRASDVVFLE